MTEPVPTPLPPLKNVGFGLPLDVTIEDRRLADGTPVVMIRWEHATGSTVFAVPHEVARQMAAMLTDAADRAATGLDLPGSRIVIPRNGS